MYLPNPELFSPEVSPVTVDPWRKALRDAAEYIRVHGHSKGCMRDGGGRVCMLGALSAVSGSDCWWSASQALRAYLVPLIGEWDGTVPLAWNDNPKTTADDVISALLSASRSERGR